MPDAPNVPRAGMMATVRNRRALVIRVKPSPTPEGEMWLVDVEYTDQDGKPGETLLWNREVGVRLTEAPALSRVHEEAPMARRDLDDDVGPGETIEAGELSAVLGEQVRQAVETLIQASSPVLEGLVGTAEQQASAKDVYIAATRVIMRLVALVFAEARELLPIGHTIYHDAYGLQGLCEELERSAGGRAERLGHRFAAWPRLLGLFQLIYLGSAHEDLPLTRYGGGLFRPGRADGDGVSRALHALERPQNHITDATVHRLIELLTRSKIRVRQGPSSVWVDARVDFSNLSSEYIGVLYEGLLDYQLRRAAKDDPMVFLAIGQQPVLPFSRLDTMTVEQHQRLLETRPGESEDADEGEADDHEPTTRLWREKVDAWARRAVREAGWAASDDEIIARARQLVRRVVLPGEWFLVRWGGTRKGAGTFYTPPPLAGPTVRRTLQPLTHEDDGRPRPPERILGLKICDPAMGSGSFLVSALRWLTDALYQSLVVHDRIARRADGCIARLSDDEAEYLPLTPDHQDFEALLRARLERHVVERCIYGVDIDPVAVELARLALWVASMDASLPFEFLDHKLMCGNALIGCWYDRFESYPITAWEREGGDKGHANFVHHYREAPARNDEKTQRKGDVWTHAIKQARGAIKAALVELIQARKQPSIFADGATPDRLLETTRAGLEALHREQNPERRAEQYASLRAGLAPLREIFDAWCALWFWPGDALDQAPTPQTLTRASEAAREHIAALREEHRFFHWELEFPDVFTGPHAGFHAIVGNPPWDIQKPNSKEFFANVDPLYRSLGKQEALRWQKQAFEHSAALERRWIAHQAHFKALSNWVSRAARPFGDPAQEPDGKGYSLARKDSAELHRVWREMRASARGYADPHHPFRHQGSADLNSYKLFLELAHALLRGHGRLGMIVPSGLYTDKGSAALRELLLDHCRWEWLFGFENRAAIFDIDCRFKFAAVVLEKGRTTAEIRAAFMRRDLADWHAAQPRTLAYPRARIAQFSPKSTAILELSAERDLAVLHELYANGVLLGDPGPDGWGLEYSTEFHLTNDSKRFAPRPKWEREGYVADEYGHWLAGGWQPYCGPKRVLSRARDLLLSRDGQQAIALADIEDVALPLYEGRMIGQFDFSERGWVSGKGRSAVWRDIPAHQKVLEPQFLISRNSAASAVSRAKVGFMAIGSATNRRSLIASVIAGLPSGNSLGILHAGDPTHDGLTRALMLAGVLNSFTFDAMLRQRLGGLNINFFVLAENPLPRPSVRLPHPLAVAMQAASLNLVSERFAGATLQIRRHLPPTSHWRRNWASSPLERVRVRSMLDALVADWYGLDVDDLGWLLRDCDWPQAPADLDPKGFWRIDKDQPPELRHTVLAQVAFQDLQRDGLQRFLGQNDGEGWMLPETLRLADYGLGNDDRAKLPQPVASALGPRFYAWQPAQSVEQSWEECERHAELLARIPSGRSTPLGDD